MRPLFIVLTVFVYNSICYSSDIKGFPARDIVIKVSSSFDNNEKKTGFGFIYSAGKDSLAIITAKSILESGSLSANDIRIQFANNVTLASVSIAYLNSLLSIAVLKVKKPDWFVWDRDLRGGEVTLGKTVLILGRYGEWDDYSERNQGRVIYVDSTKIDIESNARMEGNHPGTPVIYNDNIVGVVVEDYGHRILALPIRMIQRKINAVLEIDIDKYLLGFPYFLVGVKLNLSWLFGGTSENIYGITFASSNGLFMELGIFSPISLRFEKVFKSTITSGRLRVMDDYFQGRTQFESFSFFIQYKGKVKDINLPRYSFSNLYLGFRRLRQTPMLKINDEPWRDIREIDPAQDHFPDKLNTYILGANGSWIFYDYLVLRFDVGVSYTSGDIILIDPLEPFRMEGPNWQVYVQFNVGLLLYNGKTFRNYIR